MARLPYIPMYLSDWERDANLLSAAAEFALLKLTFKLFDAEEKGVFKAKIETLSRLFKCDTATALSSVNELCILTNTLEISLLDDGFYLIKSRRMLKESAISEKRAQAGQIGGRAKKGAGKKQNKSKSEAKPKQTHNKTLKYENESEYENEVEIVNEAEAKKNARGEKLNMMAASARSFLPKPARINFAAQTKRQLTMDAIPLALHQTENEWKDCIVPQKRAPPGYLQLPTANCQPLPTFVKF